MFGILNDKMFPLKLKDGCEYLTKVQEVLQTANYFKLDGEIPILHRLMEYNSTFEKHDENKNIIEFSREINVFTFHGNGEDIYDSMVKFTFICDGIIDKILIDEKNTGSRIKIKIHLYNIGYPIFDDFTILDKRINDVLCNEYIQKWADKISNFMLPFTSDPFAFNIAIGYSIGCGFLSRLLTSSIKRSDFPLDLIVYLAPFSSVKQMANNYGFFSSVFSKIFWNDEFEYFDVVNNTTIYKNKFCETSICIWSGHLDNIYKICKTEFEKLESEKIISPHYIRYWSHEDFNNLKYLTDVVDCLYRDFISNFIIYSNREEVVDCDLLVSEENNSESLS